MASFTMEFELIAGNQEINFLEKRFNTGSNIYNLYLVRYIKQLNKLKRNQKQQIESLKRKLSEKFSYFGKELIEINLFKTKVSQFIEKYFS